MRWPWVSRIRLEDAQQQIAELKEANAKLLDLALSKPVAAAAVEDEMEPEPQKPHRKLGADIRREFRAAAEARAAEAKIHKGSK